jgi:protein TonB
MTEKSSLTAEAADDAPAFYVWEVPGKPVSVQLHLDVVDRLEREILESFRAVTKRGSEIGGLLLGNVLRGAQRTVIVKDYETVPCEYSRGPLYLLAEQDRARLQQAIHLRSSAADPRLAVVGFFRSNTRRDLALDDEDIALIEESFPDPDQVFLLVKPFAMKAPLGGFFPRAGGRIRSGQATLQFPFRRAELVKAQPPEPAAVVEKPAPPETRAPVPPPAIPQASPQGEAPPLDPVTPSAPARHAAAPQRPAPPAAPLLGLEVPAPEPEPAPRRRLQVLIALILVLLAGAAGLFYFLSPRAVERSAAVEQDSLSLRVERNAGQLLLSWNRESAAIRNAQRAILSILDGDHKEDVELVLAQLRSGSIVYSPITNDVAFRLEVTNLQQGKSLSESVRVLAGRPSPAGAPAEQTPLKVEAAPGTIPLQAEAVKSPPPAAQPHGQAGESAAPSLPPAEAPRQEAPPAAPALPAQRGELAARLSSPELPVPVQEAPNPAPEAAAPAKTPEPAPPPPVAAEPPRPAAPQGALPAAEAQAPAAPPQAAVSPQPPAPGTVEPEPVRPAVRTGGRVTEARLIRGPAPEYPAIARQARVSGVVRVDARVGTNGRTTQVRAVSGPPLLRQAAVDAVRRWTYEPGRINGEIVETAIQVDLKFTLSR